MPKITIYSTTTCGYCHALKHYLDSKHISYEDISVDQRPDEAMKLIDTCGSMGVPCTHITLDDGREEKVLGFDKAKIDQILGLGAEMA